MKRFMVIIFALGIFLLSSVITLSACEIEVKIKGGKKQFLTTGQIVVLEVMVFLTHKNCPEGINATKFQAEGMEMLGATKWKQVSQERFVRLVKVQITGNANEKAVLHARRSCDEEGGHGVFKMKIQ